jgi:hypothetical protein
LARTGKASPIIDVFAFWVFLLKVTCGTCWTQQREQQSIDVGRLGTR